MSMKEKIAEALYYHAGVIPAARANDAAEVICAVLPRCIKPLRVHDEHGDGSKFDTGALPIVKTSDGRWFYKGHYSTSFDDLYEMASADYRHRIMSAFDTEASA